VVFSVLSRLLPILKLPEQVPVTSSVSPQCAAFTAACRRLYLSWALAFSTRQAGGRTAAEMMRLAP